MAGYPVSLKEGTIINWSLETAQREIYINSGLQFQTALGKHMGSTHHSEQKFHLALETGRLN
jgi:hypothetical protein